MDQLIQTQVLTRKNREGLLFTEAPCLLSVGAKGPGPWFNIKMSSYQYRKSHCGDKTVVRSSYLHNGISYTGKMTSLYWIGALGIPYLVLVLVHQHMIQQQMNCCGEHRVHQYVRCDCFASKTKIPSGNEIIQTVWIKDID